MQPKEFFGWLCKSQQDATFCLFLIRNLFFLWDKNLSHSQSLIKNTYFPTGKQVHIDKWDKTKQQVKGKDEEAKSLNNYLKAVKAKLYQKEAELLDRGFIITAKLLCEAYQEKIESLKEKSLFEVFTEHNHEQEKLIYSFTQAIS